MKGILAVSFGIFSLLFLTVVASAEEISDCSILDQAGQTYYLTADITDSDSDVCMDITANNITLDCQGYMIDGIDVFFSYGIRIDRASATNTNITVRDCVVTDWGYGIYLSLANNNTLANNIVKSNEDFGINLVYSSNNILTNNIVINNMDDSIYFEESTNNTLTNNIVNDNFHGIRIDLGSNYNILINNIANNNSNAGINIDGESSNNILINNTANSNIDGFFLTSDSNNNILINNTANSNSYGFILSSSSNDNILINNTANGNNVGISLSYSSNNTLTNNIVKGNEEFGIYLIYGSDNNKIYNNLFNNTENFYIASSMSYWNTTRQLGVRIYSFGTEIGGNYWTNPSGNGYSDTCDDDDRDGFCDEGYILADDNIDYLPLSDEMLSYCEPSWTLYSNQSVCYNSVSYRFNTTYYDTNECNETYPYMSNFSSPKKCRYDCFDGKCRLLRDLSPIFFILPIVIGIAYIIFLLRIVSDFTSPKTPMDLIGMAIGGVVIGLFIISAIIIIS